jgi:hypothetical protein
MNCDMPLGSIHFSLSRPAWADEDLAQDARLLRSRPPGSAQKLDPVTD